MTAACDPNIQRDPNEDSGLDGERGLARIIEFGEPVNDNLNFGEGDQTDWKFFQAPAPGLCNIVLGCDSGGAWCYVVVRDEVGLEIDRFETEGEPRVEGTVAVLRGNYYLEIMASASSSDYTIQIDYEPN